MWMFKFFNILSGIIGKGIFPQLCKSVPVQCRPSPKWRAKITPARQMQSNRRIYIFPKVESDAHILLQYRLNLLVMAGQYVFKDVVGDVVHS